MQCPVCGAYVTEEDRFCGECGEALAPSAEPTPDAIGEEPTRSQPAAIPEAEERRKTGQARAAVVAAAVIALLVCALVGGWGVYQLLSGRATPLPDVPLGTAGDVLLEETFDDPDSGWDLYAWDEAEVGYEAGAYQIQVHETRYDAWATSNQGIDLADFVIEVDARWVEGPLDNDYGVLVRYQPDGDSFYLFAVSSDGWYSVQAFRDREWESLVDWVESDAVHQGDATNHLKVECLGSQMRFVVNDVPLAQVEDASYRSGDVGLLAGTFDQGGVVVQFDNLQVRALTDQ
jgi:hypothetical protein